MECLSIKKVLAKARGH
jgi:hypothetical protein